MLLTKADRVEAAHGLIKARPALDNIFTSIENDITGTSALDNEVRDKIPDIVKFINWIVRVPDKVYVAVGCVSLLHMSPRM
jgi:hypothetical protein